MFFAVSLSLSVMAYRQTEEQSLVDKYIAPTRILAYVLDMAGTDGRNPASRSSSRN